MRRNDSNLSHFYAEFTIPRKSCYSFISKRISTSYCNLTAYYMTVWLSFFFLLTFILPGDPLPRSTIVWLRKQQRERSYLTQAQYYVRKHVCNIWLPAYEFILMYSISFFIFVYIVYLWWTPCRRCSASRASSTIKLSFGL